MDARQRSSVATWSVSSVPSPPGLPNSELRAASRLDAIPFRHDRLWSLESWPTGCNAAQMLTAGPAVPVGVVWASPEPTARETRDLGVGSRSGPIATHVSRNGRPIRVSCVTSARVRIVALVAGACVAAGMGDLVSIARASRWLVQMVPRPAYGSSLPSRARRPVRASRLGLTPIARATQCRWPSG